MNAQDRRTGDGPMPEHELLRRIADRSRAIVLPTGGTIEIGPGDDAAVLHTQSGDRLALTVDQLVEGRHFAPGTPVALVAHKAVCRSVSDLAAMGAAPSWSMATGLLPSSFDEDDALCAQLAEVAQRYGCPIIGGDLARHDGPMVLTVTCAGIPHASRGPVLRSEARVGDSVWVTGMLGGSFESGRHLRFEPRLTQANELCSLTNDRGEHKLGAMLDLSDGLGRDAARIADASGVAVEIESASIPRHAGITDWRNAASDGEDYELLFTVRHSATVPGAVNGVAVTRIGEVVARSSDGHAVTFIEPDGSRHNGSRLGWDH
ncbi:MAG: thiamine-phosphate kinase [Planctomycetota bacterium]